MIDVGATIAPDRDEDAHPIHLVGVDAFTSWLEAQSPPQRAILTAQGLKAAEHSSAILPGVREHDWSVVALVKDPQTLSPWCLARLAETLPEGRYRLSSGTPGAALLGWALAQHRFERYLPDKPATGPRVLLTNAPAAIDAAVREAQAVALVRDLVNTPAADMGPADLEAQGALLASAYGATIAITKGAELEQGFPMIHAVGRAAARHHAPRLIELTWGNPANPKIAIVGKGVTFDSGGLDIKPSAGMRLMKKDMGGAAHALALGQLIMQARLPVRLHLLIPAVENAISGDAFRPGDVLHSRAGLSVEIANTDAEGRLVLADALTKAVEAQPTLIIDFATLTGAARVALGPDLPAVFANDDALADALDHASCAAADPLWRLPLHAGYNEMLKSDIADLNNAPDGGFAGAITAALFLARFVPASLPWLHLDTYSWNATARAGRPKGGDALGLRAVWALLRMRFP